MAKRSEGHGREDAAAGGPAARLRVLLAIDHLWYGGAQSVLVALLTLLDRERFEVVAVNLGGGDAPLRARVAELADGYHELAAWRLGDVRAIRSLKGLVRRRRIDVLHAHLNGAEVYCGLAGLLSRRPSVTTLHSVARDRAAYGRGRALAANFATRHLGDRLLAVSDAVRDSYRAALNLPAGRIEVLPNVPVAPLVLAPAFDRERKRAELELSGLVVASVSRLAAPRDHETLIRALAVSREGPPVTLLVVGGGERLESLERLAGELGVAARVRFLGTRADAAEVLAASDVMCQPTLYEGLPVTVLDAMSLGVPVVASAVEGIVGLVEDGVTGLLVPPAEPRALAAALDRLAGDRELRGRIASSARRMLDQRYDGRKWSARHEAVYEELAAARPAARKETARRR